MAKKDELTRADSCPQEKRIVSIEKDVSEIKDVLNGRGGVMAIVVKQAEISKNQGENIDKLMKMVDALRIKDVETDKEKAVKASIYIRNAKLEMDKRNTRRWLFGAVLSSLTIIITLLIFYFKLKQQII